MSKVRIHIIMGTAELPNRQLTHDETSHDIIDIPAEPTWDLREIEMTKTGRVRDPVSGDSAYVGRFLGASGVWGYQHFKYRAVFTEVIREDGDASEDIRPELEAGDIHDVQVIEEGDNQDA